MSSIDRVPARCLKGGRFNSGQGTDFFFVVVHVMLIISSFHNMTAVITFHVSWTVTNILFLLQCQDIVMQTFYR